MSNRRSRRYTPRPAPKPLQPPPIRHLTGWTLDQLAEATGVERRQAARVLMSAVARGEVVEMHCGGKTLFARLGGGAITEVAR